MRFGDFELINSNPKGIFRISGTAYVIQGIFSLRLLSSQCLNIPLGLKEAIDSGVPVNLQAVDPHDLVGVLRL